MCNQLLVQLSKHAVETLDYVCTHIEDRHLVLLILSRFFWSFFFSKFCNIVIFEHYHYIVPISNIYKVLNVISDHLFIFFSISRKTPLFHTLLQIDTHPLKQSLEKLLIRFYFCCLSFQCHIYPI